GRQRAVRDDDVGLHQSGNAARTRGFAQARRGLLAGRISALQERRDQERRRSARQPDAAEAEDAEPEWIHRASGVEARDAPAFELSLAVGRPEGRPLRTRARELMATPSWNISGQYFETCNCDFICPCIVGQMAVRPSKGSCTFAMAMQIERGSFGGVSL